MPDKNLTVVSYAAGAGLAAIALVYVFAPTYLIDRKNAVGLRNVGNDCFINSVLQALAGLGTLRLYLIRETHRRDMDVDGSVYGTLVPPPSSSSSSEEDGRGVGPKRLREWEIRSLQSGAVTRGLKEILDRLNERSLAKKAISPRGFVGVLERAFGQTINRQQQDAQEFLQLLVEKLRDEYVAGLRAREQARKTAMASQQQQQPQLDGEQKQDGEDGKNGREDGAASAAPAAPAEKEEEGFPLEGEHEAQSECRTCGYKTKPKKELFCMLTLSVPQTASTTLNSCFDLMFKTEHIEGFKCENCRLLHARDLLLGELAQSTSATFRARAEHRLGRIQRCLDEGDPESPPPDLELPDIRYAPRRTISRHHRVTRFPRVLVVHLSRSIYDDQISQKNLAKVSFPDLLPLGGLRDGPQKKYRLLGLVTHKGGHQSGHYQSFRRQVVSAPYSNPNTASDVYLTTTTATANPSSPAATPTLGPAVGGGGGRSGASPMASATDLLGDSSGTSTMSLVSGGVTEDGSGGRGSSKESVATKATSTTNTAATTTTATTTTTTPPPTQLSSAARDAKDRSDTGSIRSVAASARSTLSRISPSHRHRSDGVSDRQRVASPSPAPAAPKTSKPSVGSSNSSKSKKKTKDRWWRISDDKCREARTSEVLDSEREVYLLFYELEEPKN